MLGPPYARHRCLAAGLLAASGRQRAAWPADPSDAARLSRGRTGGAADGSIVEPWSVELDAEGVVAGHRLTFELEGADTTLRTGRAASRRLRRAPPGR